MKIQKNILGRGKNKQQVMKNKKLRMKNEEFRVKEKERSD